MRQNVISAVQEQIEVLLKSYLETEAPDRSVTVEAFTARAFEEHTLLWEIRLVLGVLGSPWQCDALVKGIYEALKPHNLSVSELHVIMMSLHVEVRTLAKFLTCKNATIRYIVGETTRESSDPGNDSSGLVSDQRAPQLLPESTG